MIYEIVRVIATYHAHHIHLISRRGDDTPNSRGGVRGVIPDKMDYYNLGDLKKH